jgi:hypothetical protein
MTTSNVIVRFVILGWMDIHHPSGLGNGRESGVDGKSTKRKKEIQNTYRNSSFTESPNAEIE